MRQSMLKNLISWATGKNQVLHILRDFGITVLVVSRIDIVAEKRAPPMKEYQCGNPSSDLLLLPVVQPFGNVVIVEFLGEREAGKRSVFVCLQMLSNAGCDLPRNGKTVVLYPFPINTVKPRVTSDGIRALIPESCLFVDIKELSHDRIQQETASFVRILLLQPERKEEKKCSECYLGNEINNFRTESFRKIKLSLCYLGEGVEFALSP